MTDQLKRRYGWRPSLPDHRDLDADTSGLTIKAEVDPRGKMQKPYDQLELGSCTANTVAGAVEYDRILDGKDQAGTPARLYIYYRERYLEGSLGQGDTGAFGRDGFKAMQTWGAPPEVDDPYDITKFQVAPTAQLDQDAGAHKLTKPYKAVSRSISAFKQVLSNDQSIAIGFSVYSSFESDQAMSSGIMPIPTTREQLLGGHEVLVVGYLEAYPKYFLVRNSWGQDVYLGLVGADEYGGGYFLMPTSVILNSKMSSDFRTIVRTA